MAKIVGCARLNYIIRFRFADESLHFDYGAADLGNKQINTLINDYLARSLTALIDKNNAHLKSLTTKSLKIGVMCVRCGAASSPVPHGP